MENAEYLILRGIPIINSYNQNEFLDRLLCVNDEVFFVQNAKWHRFDPEWVFFEPYTKKFDDFFWYRTDGQRENVMM